MKFCIVNDGWYFKKARIKKTNYESEDIGE